MGTPEGTRRACNPAEGEICRDSAGCKWCSFAAACAGDELARRAYRFAYGNDEDAWETIAALFSEDAAAEKVRAVEARIPDALSVQLERGDSRVAMSVLAALKGGEKKPAQLRDAVQLRNRQFFTNTYPKPMTDAVLLSMIPARMRSVRRPSVVWENNGLRTVGLIPKVIAVSRPSVFPSRRHQDPETHSQ